MKVSGARFGGRDIESMRLNGAFVLKRKEDTPTFRFPEDTPQYPYYGCWFGKSFGLISHEVFPLPNGTMMYIYVTSASTKSLVQSGGYWKLAKNYDKQSTWVSLDGISWTLFSTTPTATLNLYLDAYSEIETIANEGIVP